MCFSPAFYLGTLYRAEGQVCVCVTVSEADAACKDNYCFPKASAIKNIMLPCGPGRKGKKEEGRQGRTEVKSVDLGTNRPIPSPTPTTLGRGKNRVDTQDAPQSGEPRQKWSNPSKDSHIPWIETQSQDLGDQSGPQQ